MIETTGLADPAPVLLSLMTSDLVIDRYALNGVVTVVDATAGEATLDRYAEARAQAAVADLLLVSKTDLAEPDAAARLARPACGAGAERPGARVRRGHRGGRLRPRRPRSGAEAAGGGRLARFEAGGHGHAQGIITTTRTATARTSPRTASRAASR